MRTSSLLLLLAWGLAYGEVVVPIPGPYDFDTTFFGTGPIGESAIVGTFPFTDVDTDVSGTFQLRFEAGNSAIDSTNADSNTGLGVLADPPPESSVIVTGDSGKIEPILIDGAESLEQLTVTIESISVSTGAVTSALFEVDTTTNGEDISNVSNVEVTQGDSLSLVAVSGKNGAKLLSFDVRIQTELLCDPNTLGDIDSDGAVGFSDFLALADNFGTSATSHTTGDINCDGSVNFSDFLSLSEHFGSTTAVQVPEPNNICILSLVCVAQLLAGSRTRQKQRQ